MKALMMQWIERWGYAGIFFLIFIENVFPPIPSEVILTFSGYLCSAKTLNKWWAILAATLGSVVGAVLLYLVGSYLGEGRLEKVCGSRIGRILHLSYEDILRSGRWFQEKGEVSVLVCRCIPILRSVISIPAGMSRMNLLRFLPYTAVGSFLWNVILVNLGILTGAAWETVSKTIGSYSHLVWIGLCAGIGIWWWIRRKKS
jgi:membrane protein DedA with SNARE-associated domain